MIAALIIALSPMERDAAPIPRYLREEGVSAVIAAAPWSTCPGGRPRTLHLILTVDPTGAVRILEGAGPEDSCVEGLIRALAFGPHDEVEERIALDLPITADKVFAPLTVSLLSRPVDPLFLWTPQALDPAAAAALRAALGLAAP